MTGPNNVARHLKHLAALARPVGLLALALAIALLGPTSVGIGNTGQQQVVQAAPLASQQIAATNIGPGSSNNPPPCFPSQWQFIINQLADDSLAPASITVYFNTAPNTGVN